jgi:hypothetical protein
VVRSGVKYILSEIRRSFSGSTGYVVEAMAGDVECGIH